MLILRGISVEEPYSVEPLDFIIRNRLPLGVVIFRTPWDRFAIILTCFSKPHMGKDHHGLHGID